LESNWRWNVWDFGLSPIPERLAARFVDDPNTAMGAREKPGDPTMHAWYNRSVVTGFWSDMGYRLKANPGKNFPYGWAVEPDHP
jgi:hypothetical protein